MMGRLEGMAPAEEVVVITTTAAAAAAAGCEWSLHVGSHVVEVELLWLIELFHAHPGASWVV